MIRKLAFVAGSVLPPVVLAGGWFAGAGWWTERRELRDRKPWLREATVREELRRELPDLTSTPHTRQIEALAAAVGLDLAPPEPGHVRPTPPDRAALLDVVSRLSPVVRSELVRTFGDVGTPPPEVLKFFDAKGAAFDELEAWLVAAPPPQWERRAGSRAPALLEQLRAAALFDGVALERARGGDAAGALRTLEAAWKLAEGLAPRPEPELQVARLEIERDHLATLRRVDATSSEWIERLRTVDPAPDLRRALRIEALRTDLLLGLPEPESAESGRFAKAARSVREGFAAPAATSATGGLLPVLLPLADQDLAADPCRDVTVAAVPLGKDDLPAAVHALPDRYADAWRRLGRYRFETELTRKVLEARAIRAATGLWPPIVPGIETSSCGKARWSWSIGGDLRPTLELTPKVALAAKTGRPMLQEWRGPDR